MRSVSLRAVGLSLTAVMSLAASAAQGQVLSNGVRTIFLERGPGTGSVAMAVAYHPVFNRYYASNGGNAAFAAWVYNAAGTRIQDLGALGIDARGWAYNPSTNQLEVSPFNAAASGLKEAQVDGSGNLTGGVGNLLATMTTANSQSMAAFDPGRNVLYSRGTDNVVVVTNRANGAQSGTINLDFAGAGVTPTQVTQYPIGYDRTHDRLIVTAHDTDRALVFNMAGGFVGASQLDIDVSSAYRMGYANGQIFVFDGVRNGWQGYDILGDANCLEIVHTGRGSGTLNGVAFPLTSFVIRSTVDPAARQSFGGGFFITHATSTVDISGVGTVTVITPTRTFVNQGGQIVGYSRSGTSGADLYNGPSDPSFASWDMTTPIGPIAGNANLLQWASVPQINTSGGILIFNNGPSPATFTVRRCGAGSESCDIIDFQSLAEPGTGNRDVGTQVDEDGYRITKAPGEPFNFNVRQTGNTAYPGSTALYNNTVNGLNILARIDGAPFNVTSIDLANLNSAGPAPVTFTGFYAGGGSVVLATNTGDPSGLPNTLNRITFPSTFCGLERLEWRQESPFHQFDNIHVATTTRIDFQSLAQNNNGTNSHGYQYDEDGYRFTKVGSGPELRSFGTLENRYPGSTALFNDQISAVTTLARVDGGPFDICEMSLANLNGTGPAPLAFVGTRIDGSTVNFNTDTGDPTGLPNTLQRRVYPSDFRLLTKLEWTQTNPFHQFDDVIVACSNPCYACDCDLSTGIGTCDIFDFLCFQNRFAAQQSYACNCDRSTGNNVCDIFDFLCFQNEFATECGRRN